MGFSIHCGQGSPLSHDSETITNGAAFELVFPCDPEHELVLTASLYQLSLKAIVMIIPANTSDITTEQELFGELVKSVAVILTGRSCVLHMQVRRERKLDLWESHFIY
jgi:hypothetical protein